MKPHQLRTLSERLDRAMRDRGLRQADIARQIGLDKSSVSLLLRGKRKLQEREGPAIAAMLGVNIDWLLTGRGAMWIDPLEIEDRDGQFERIPLDEEAGRAFAPGFYSPSIPGAIPELGDEAGAGEGTIGDVYNIPVGDDTISGHRIVAEWRLPDAYLRYELKLTNKDTIVVPVQGDSMSPTYRDGDRVIVDLRNRDFGDDGVYLITDGNSAPRIKRLEYIFNSTPPSVRIISDNPASKEQEATIDDLRVIGRVAGRITRG